MAYEQVLSQDEVDDELRHLVDGYLRPARS